MLGSDAVATYRYGEKGKLTKKQKTACAPKRSRASTSDSNIDTGMYLCTVQWHDHVLQCTMTQLFHSSSFAVLM